MDAADHTHSTHQKPLQKPSPSLPASLGIKKRKPRSATVVSAANYRARTALAPASVTAPPAHITHHAPSTKPADTKPTPHRTTMPPYVSESKRKGLRHFAVRVSRKVEQKRVTTYNEVADELVAEERRMRHRELSVKGEIVPEQMLESAVTVDEKNIRRRVYDSLNVLMAMSIIAKEKKLISWQGLAMAQSARGSGEIATMKAAIAEKKRQLEEKASMLAEVEEQYMRTAAIVERNRASSGMPGLLDEMLMDTDVFVPNGILPVHHQYPERLGIPFIIVSAPKDTAIELEMDETREDICFTFNSAFAIFDDREVMRRMVSPINPPPSADDQVSSLF